MIHISICICTFKRPHFLERLLTAINNLSSDGDFDYSATVVDNDDRASAQDIVERARAANRYEIRYSVEPERNISLARNRSVRMARGDLIAFIDDDEYPDRDWLLHHLRSLLASGSDGVLGPVIPDFEIAPPRWLIKSGLLNRKRHVSNTPIADPHDLRTGNVLLWKRIVPEDSAPFDPRYGRSGGGDAAFFLDRIREGRKFIWCDEARVYETIPPDRQKLTYHMKRASTRGMTTAWNTPFFSSSTLVSFSAIPVYALALPFSFLIGRHAFARILVKGCDHLAKLLTYAGLDIVKERPY